MGIGWKSNKSFIKCYIGLPIKGERFSLKNFINLWITLQTIGDNRSESSHYNNLFLNDPKHVQNDKKMFTNKGKHTKQKLEKHLKYDLFYKEWRVVFKRKNNC